MTPQQANGKDWDSGVMSPMVFDVPIAELAEIVWSARKSVIQVETLSSYGVPDDDRLYALWTTGTEPSAEDLAGYNSWFSKVRSATEREVQVNRIHIVPDLLTSYLKFEIEVAYLKFCLPNGERVGIVSESEAKRLGITVANDFYLIDEERLLLPLYDAQNRFVGLREDRRPKSLEDHLRLKTDLLSAAVPVEQFYAQLK